VSWNWGQDCDGISRKWNRSVSDQQEVWQECKRFSKKCHRVVRVSSGNGTEV